MRTVHETEALRPSDPVPKHHSSNPSNRFQRIKLVLNNEGKKEPHEKGSTPASPSSHAHPLASTPTVPPVSADTDYAHNNVVYLQDLASSTAPKIVQFPPDITFTERELSLPAPELFQTLRRQLHWAMQEGDQLRVEADALEKTRKEEWEAKELLMENYMEAEAANARRRDAGGAASKYSQPFEHIEHDIVPSTSLELSSRDGKLPWWREEAWTSRRQGTRDVRQDIPENDVKPHVPVA